MLVVISVLVILGFIGMFDAAKDTLAHHYGVSIFSEGKSTFWDANLSWCNKWLNCELGKELFWGSSTVFVFLTDGWHLAKFLQLQLGMIFPAFFLMILLEPYLKRTTLFNHFLLFAGCYVLCTVVQNGVFTLFYDYFLLK